MRVYDLIMKKKRGDELLPEEVEELVKSYTAGDVPDYQMSAFLMAVCFRGMSSRETRALTLAILNSGESVDLSRFGSLSVDKHSTGGVGDKTTLIIAPIVSSLGCCVAKMSGRGLGHTGGTVDKLEAIPGYRTELSPSEFSSQLDKIGIAVVGQSGNLAPADKKIYALRDVTGTVDCVPLIASSVMGKKLASGASSIVLDVKCGKGAFMKTPNEARELAQCMVEIGKSLGRRVSAFITDMDTPLGKSIGNSLELIEAIDVLRGKGESDLTELCVALSSEMVSLALGIEPCEAEERVRASIADGSAYRKMLEWLDAQGADVKYIENPELFGQAEHSLDILADENGFISQMDAEKIGLCAMELGAGRRTKEDKIDPLSGIVLVKKTGDAVRAGELIARLYSGSCEKLSVGECLFKEAIVVSHERPKEKPLIYSVIR